VSNEGNRKLKDTILLELQALEGKQQHSVIPKGVTALELADMVMRGEVKLSPQQMRVMIELLPFHAPKLSAVGVGYLNDNTFAQRLDRAIDRSDRARPRLIEARATEVED
jgi:hypothetical protein